MINFIFSDAYTLKSCKIHSTRISKQNERYNEKIRTFSIHIFQKTNLFGSLNQKEGKKKAHREHQNEEQHRIRVKRRVRKEQLYHRHGNALTQEKTHTVLAKRSPQGGFAKRKIHKEHTQKEAQRKKREHRIRAFRAADHTAQKLLCRQRKPKYGNQYDVPRARKAKFLFDFGQNTAKRYVNEAEEYTIFHGIKHAIIRFKNRLQERNAHSDAIVRRTEKRHGIHAETDEKDGTVRKTLVQEKHKRHGGKKGRQKPDSRVATLKKEVLNIDQNQRERETATDPFDHDENKIHRTPNKV